MERLTRQDIDDILVEFDTMDYMPTNLCENAEFERNQYKGKLVKMAEEIIDYKQLEEQIGCPLEVRCKLCAGLLIYTCNGEAKIQNCYFDNIFIQQKSGKYDMLLYCDYKKTWWLKEDRSE